LNYCLFVTWFPQLIVGPIVIKEVLPQFIKASIYRFNPEDMAVGLTIFLWDFLKGGLADSIVVYAAPVFINAAQGVPLTSL